MPHSHAHPHPHLPPPPPPILDPSDEGSQNNYRMTALCTSYMQEGMTTSGQVTRNHHVHPPTSLSSQLRQPLVFQIENIGEKGYVYEDGDRIFHWRFVIQDLFQIDNTTIKIVSSPSICPPTHCYQIEHAQVVFRLYLNSDGTSCTPHASAFFVVMVGGSTNHSGQVSVSLHHHLHWKQLVRGCDTSVDGSHGTVRVLCGCPDFYSMYTMRQSAKGGIVCVDIQFL